MNQSITPQMYQALQMLRKAGGVMQDERFLLDLETLPNEPVNFEESKQLVNELVAQGLVEALAEVFTLTDKGEQALTEFIAAAKNRVRSI